MCAEIFCPFSICLGLPLSVLDWQSIAEKGQYCLVPLRGAGAVEEEDAQAWGMTT